jgi:hypothetical protein
MSPTPPKGKSMGWPSILTDEECDQISGMIVATFHAQELLRCAHIIDTVEYELGKDVLRRTPRHAIRRMEGLKCTQGKPIGCLSCDTELINRVYDDLACQLESAAAVLVCDLDESESRVAANLSPNTLSPF